MPDWELENSFNLGQPDDQKRGCNVDQKPGGGANWKSPPEPRRFFAPQGSFPQTPGECDEDVELPLRVHFRPPNQRIESAREDPAKGEPVGLSAGIHSGIAELSHKGCAGQQSIATPERPLSGESSAGGRSELRGS